MLFIALANAFTMQPGYRFKAFVDSYLLDEFTYAHKYFKRGK